MGMGPPGSMSRRDDLDMVAAHVEKWRGHNLAVPELPDLGLGHGDEVLRLDHVVGHARAGHQLDVTLDAVRSGQDGYSRLVRIRHGSLLARFSPPSPTIIVVHARPAETGRYNPVPEIRSTK